MDELQIRFLYMFYFSCEYQPIFAEKYLSICRLYSGGVISVLPEGACTMVDHGLIRVLPWWNRLPTNRSNPPRMMIIRSDVSSNR
jgi:hypothetical protein